MCSAQPQAGALHWASGAWAGFQFPLDALGQGSECRAHPTLCTRGLSLGLVGTDHSLQVTPTVYSLHFSLSAFFKVLKGHSLHFRGQLLTSVSTCFLYKLPGSSCLSISVSLPRSLSLLYQHDPPRLYHSSPTQWHYFAARYLGRRGKEMVRFG